MTKKITLVLLVLLTACSQKPTSKPEVNTVFYEIFVGSFYDSDGDGQGDLRGVLEKLDYIQNDLGATGIWLMPIHPSRSYHKYDVMDYQAIDPLYGTMEDFDALVLAMQQRGMDLILDLVLNHTSNEHPWFIKAKEEVLNNRCDSYCDYYHFSDTLLPNYRLLLKDVYYEAEFADTMPDLNLDNPKVREEIELIIAFWLDKGVKGFRLDATTHFYADDIEKNIKFLSWIKDVAQSINPDTILVGEAWTAPSIVQSMYASEISFFNFALAQNSGRIVKDINRENGQGLAEYITSYQQSIRSYDSNAIDSIYLSNHDQGRSASYFANQLEKQKLAASIYLLIPGNVYIYYGEEIGMIGSGRDENKRLAMPWGEKKGTTLGPHDADYELDQSTTVKDALKKTDSLLNHYKNVIKIRNAFPELSRGESTALNLGNNALFALQFNDLIVVHNLSSKLQEFSGSYDIIEDALGGKKASEVISLEGYSSVIIRIK